LCDRCLVNFTIGGLLKGLPNYVMTASAKESINYRGSDPSIYAIGAASSNACKEYNNEP